METLGSILNIGSSFMTGGLTGILGSVFGGVFKYYQAKQIQQFKREDNEHELKLLGLEMEANREETENEIKIVTTEGSFSGMKASINADSKIGTSYRWVNSVRSLFRPFLTACLLAVSFLIFKDLMTVVNGGSESSIGLSIEEAKTLLKYVVESLVFTATAAILWWFGERNFAAPGTKNK